jgi:hypothetical protein
VTVLAAPAAVEAPKPAQRAKAERPEGKPAPTAKAA